MIKQMSMSNGVLRVLVSIIAIPFILAASYFGGYFFLFVISVIALISFFEFSIIAQNKNMHANLFVGLISVFFFVVNSYLKFFDQFHSLLLIITLLCLIELFRNKGSALLNLGAAILGIAYIGLFTSSLVLLREFYNQPEESYSHGGLLIITIFASIWICDSAAYYIGTAFGRHKLFPRVSPKKSWEGAIAGLLFAILTMVAAKLISLDFLSWTSALGIGGIIGILGQVGDLIESLFKRDAGVKDSSGLIPGHGGIFDRFDSLIYSAPFILILLELVER